MLVNCQIEGGFVGEVKLKGESRSIVKSGVYISID